MECSVSAMRGVMLFAIQWCYTVVQRGGDAGREVCMVDCGAVVSYVLICLRLRDTAGLLASVTTSL